MAPPCSSILALLLCTTTLSLGAPQIQPQQDLQVPLSSPATVRPLAQRKLHGRFLHISDFHPDEFYKVHTSIDDDHACHHGHGSAGYYGAETTDCDSPLTLIDATFDWIKANLQDQLDFVVWTGDNARHDSDENIPRTEKEVLRINRLLASKFFDAFSEGDKLAIPIVPTIGNNDFLPHNIFYPGPNEWLQQFAHIWRPFIPKEQQQTFEHGGWHYIEVIPNRLAVFNLNTMYFFDRNAAVDDCMTPSEPGYQQMEWLRVQLQFMRRRGMKAILTGHVPPARTSSKHNWDETCWQKYTLWLKQYRDIVVASLYGHMNIDHFFFQDTDQIDLALLTMGANASRLATREVMDEEFSVQSKSKYLRELRDDWAKLPKPPVKTAQGSEDDNDDDNVGEEKKNKKKGDKKHKKEHVGKYAERYHLSLVSPPIVPNYLPTLRIIEYNITSLEDVPTWLDSPSQPPPQPVNDGDELDGSPPSQSLDLRSLDADKSKNKHPGLHIPEPPSKSSPPGPAYSPQPFTLTGYTQYFANLTHINNEEMASTTTGLENFAWFGRLRIKEPPALPKFDFKVEYTTFDDRVYNLRDLTVRSMLHVAYHMGQGVNMFRSAEWAEDATAGQEIRDWEHGDNDDHDDATKSDGGDAQGKKKKKRKKQKKNKKHGNSQKLWLHFLRHAFVSTVEEEELKQV